MVIDKYIEKDGERVPVYRLCFDSRAPNSRKVAEPFPETKVEDIFNNLAGKSHQSIMDIPKAFFLIEVDKESRKYSSFTHPENGKRYWFKGMIMGDVNSPTHLQTFMQRVFKEDKPYMDDLAIADQTFEQHLQHLELVFQRCLENNVLLSPKKCFFNMTSLKVLGRITDKNYRRVDDETIERIKNSSRPYNIKQLMSFKGLVNWMRDYLPNLGEKMQPLYALTQAKDIEDSAEYTKRSKIRYLLRTKIDWTPELTQIFEEVKLYCSNPVNLYYVDYSRPIYVNTDASLKGWGGILYQLDDNGNKQICGIKSGSWNKVQAKWPTVEQEAYAIYRTVIDFESYLIGRPFTLFTDSQNLTFLKESPSRKIQRWRLALQMFSFSTNHIAGDLNIEADSLSRISCHDKSLAE
jgi:RNase H-like domain found in reverse transcriptase/Reverse transcriptase (RNA-dependent DNA polymerase)